MGRHSHRAPSVADSVAEYFDASEVITIDTSSEAEASDESGLSDITTSNSEPEEGHGKCWSAAASHASKVTFECCVNEVGFCFIVKHFVTRVCMIFF